jgi:lipopolysaccharide/colanic/teichoic acid biosynthesis glycosyltransferase
LVALIDGRPVLFSQDRLGRAGVPFRILKFRTMSVGAPEIRLPDGSAFAGARDARVTPLGDVLRRWSLDELPQLVNVLRGDMSLVGPRPDKVDQLRYYEGNEYVKLEMRPGLTGLAQVRGRNAISWKHRKRWDRWYVQHWSLRLDWWILIRTVGVVFRREGIEVAIQAERPT